MPTYVERTNASGGKKVKAIARCWDNGRQVTRTKTFNINERHLAEQWAEGIEAKMQKAKALSTVQVNDASLEDDVLPLRKVLGRRIDAMQNIRSIISGKITIATINMGVLIDYFQKRAGMEATAFEIHEEKKLLKDLIVEYAGDSQQKRGNMVETAYDAALCDGIVFK